MSFSRFFTDIADLEQIDWEVMQAQYWNDTPEDPDPQTPPPGRIPGV